VAAMSRRRLIMGIVLLLGAGLPAFEEEFPTRNMNRA